MTELLLLSLSWFLLVLEPIAWYYLHCLLYAVIHHLTLQYQLSFIGAAPCMLVPLLSLPSVYLYLPPLLSGCAFLHWYVLHSFLKTCQLWQVPSCEYPRRTCMRLHVCYKWPALHAVFSDSHPRWQGL